MNRNSNQKHQFNIEHISSQWLSYNRHAYKPNTIQKYRYHLKKYILPSSLSQKLVCEITSMDLADFSDSLINQNLSYNTINDILLVLGSLLRFAHKFLNNKLIPVPYVKGDKKEMRVLSRKEQIILENYIDNEINPTTFGIILALYTGIRIGELCALQWKDIDSGNINIHKTMYRIKKDQKTEVVIASPKTVSSFRIIPIPAFLKYKINSFRQEDDFYVIGSKKTPVVEPRLMQIRFKKIIKQCNFENVTFHTLRHTFATRCVECGFDIKSLSEILGHSDVKTTLNRYVHSTMEQKQINMDKLESATA